MAAKVIKVAVPQDFAPFGSAGLDLKPQGYDIDMAQPDRQGARREGRDRAGHQRQPHSLFADHKADLVISSLGKNAEREKVIDFSIAYAPFFSGVFGTKEIAVKDAADLKGKTVGATRGAIEEQELTKIGAARRDHQALRGQQRHHRGLRVRPGRSDRHRQYGGRRDRGERTRRARRCSNS